MRGALAVFASALVASVFFPAPSSAGIGYSQLSLETCSTDDASGPYQSWDYGKSLTVRTFELWGSHAGWEVLGDAVPNASFWAPPGGGRALTLTPGVSSTIVDAASGLCVTAAVSLPHAGLTLQPCSSSDLQTFRYTSSTGVLTHVASGLCVDAGAPRFGCLPGSIAAAFPYCNTSLPFPDRVADLVGRLSLQEKSLMLDTSSGGSPTAGLQTINIWDEGLHGVANNVGVGFVTTTPYATAFPQPITSACSFNRSLWTAIGATISEEFRAFSNAGHAGLTAWSPNINEVADPRWGRGQETPGEDPFVSGEYGAAYARGMQEGEDPRYIKTAVCAKHWAAYNLELWNGTDRHHFNAILDPATMIDYYFPAFEQTVRAGNAAQVMCSYNAVNGVPSCANTFLNTVVMRNTYGFDGFITSDCGAVTDIPVNHMYTNSTDSTAAATLHSGMDIGCDDYLSHAGLIAQAIDDGAITVADVDKALSNVLSVRFRLGEFDPAENQPYRSISTDVICSADHVALATDAARQSFVLLKNANNALPLTRSSISSFAVIGPVADSPIVNGGPNYAGIPCGGSAITIRGAFEAASPALAVNYAAGCADVACASTAGFAAAAQAASTSDATIIAVGIDQTVEDEGLDRVNITLPGFQNQLISQTCAAAKGVCIVFLMSGGCQDMAAAIANVPAVFYGGFPGGTGALAILDLIFGDAVPAGRLTQTFYPADFVNQIAMFDMNMRPGPSVYWPYTNPGKTYLWYTGQAVFPFGFGLSYTTFVVGVSGPSALPAAGVRAYLDAHPALGSAFAPIGVPARPDENPVLGAYTVNVTNTGSRDADYVVLGFLVAPGAGTNGVPIQQLFGFERVFVPAGQTVTVWLGVAARSLTRVVESAENVGTPEFPLRVKRVAVPGQYTVRVGVRGPGTDENEVAETSFVVA